MRLYDEENCYHKVKIYSDGSMKDGCVGEALVFNDESISIPQFRPMSKQSNKALRDFQNS